MKLIQCKIASLLFVFFSLYANANNPNEELFNKMTNDLDVTNFINNKVRLGIVNSLKTQEGYNKEIIDKMEFVKNENTILVDRINSKYPEFKMLNTLQQNELMNKLMLAPALDAYWTCVTNKLKTFSILVLGESATLLTKAVFAGCVMCTFVSEVILALTTDGSTITVLAAGAPTEVVACRALATGVINYNILQADLAAFVLAVWAC